MTTHEQWISSARAHDLLLRNSSIQNVSEVLLRRLSIGMVRARAGSIQMEGMEEREGAVPVEFWSGGSRSFDLMDWAAGDFARRPNLGWHMIYGVEFDARQIEKMCNLGLSDRSEKPPRGRRKFDWWEDLWIEVAASLYVGDLQPRCQADLQNAILDWVAHRGHELGTTAAKDRARKLWMAIQSKDRS